MKTDGDAITIQNLSFSTQTKQIIDAVSLAVRHKQIAGIIGPNGSGKMTLFNIHTVRCLPKRTQCSSTELR